MSNQILLEQIIFPPKSLVNNKIYLFLYSLIKNIIIKPKKYNLNHLWIFINEINSKIIKVKNRQICVEYNTKNLLNIFDFVKNQNKIFAGDILEGILIIIFSSCFRIDTKDNFEKYIFFSKNEKENKLYKSGIFHITDWLITSQFVPQELQNLNNLLQIEDKYINDNNKLLKESPLYNLLFEIQKHKLNNLKEKNENKNIDKIIYKQNFENKKYYDDLFLEEEKNVKLIKLFLISVYIYYQTKNHSNMKYIKESSINGNKRSNNLAIIPFNFNMAEARLSNIFSNSVFATLKLDSRISEISLSNNFLEHNGFFDLAKSLIFNKNIEKCDMDDSLIKSYYLEYFHLGFGLYDNYTLKELNLSCNLINKDTEKYLVKVLSHLKGLRTLNLSVNNIKRGAASFFILLKQLFRQSEINLETLKLINCNLNNSSLYELSELLCSPYCKLKKLYLNINIIKDSISFLKKLKRNKSLEELHLNKTNINDNDITLIERVISNTHIQTLYLYNNLISNFDNLIRIIYRTKIINFVQDKKKENEIILKEQSFLENLDLSDNPIINKNVKGVNLICELKNKTCLSCLDLSHILKGNDPEKFEMDEEYENAVNNLSNEIKKNKDGYLKNIINKQKIDTEIDITSEEIKYLENNFLNKYDNEITEILKAQIKFQNPDKKIIYLKKTIKSLIYELSQNYSKIKDMLIIKDSKDKKEKINFDAYKKLENYLLQNILLKKAKINMKQNEEEKIERQLIII